MTKPSYSMWQLVKYMPGRGTRGSGGPLAQVGSMCRDLVKKRQWIWAAIFVSSMCASGTAMADDWRTLEGPAIRRAFSGREYGDGAHYAHRFLRDGALEGTEMGRTVEGRWRVEGKQLCTDRTKPRTSQQCYEVERSGDEVRLLSNGYAVFNGSLSPIAGSPDRSRRRAGDCANQGRFSFRRPGMNQTIIGVATAAIAAAAGAQTLHFDQDAVGSAPSGWNCGVTGRGAPRWRVENHPSHPGGRVLLQSGSGTFPWCVRTGTSITDGFVEARFVPISGLEDQAGGVVWRWKDGDNYYVARANALENNVSLYYTERGSRKTLKYVDAPVARGVPHTVRVEFTGNRIAVSLDGTRYIDWTDEHIAGAGAGAVGVWTKADSVTAFTEFSYGSVAR